MVRTRIRPVLGPQDANEAARWLDTQIDKGENSAGDRDVDARVLKFARLRVQEFCDRVLPLHQRWAVTHHMLAGNTIDRAGPVDVHIPELYKMLETAVPRLEEAILEKDPWFRCRPRSETSESKANAIAALMEWQLAQMRFDRQVQPGLRDMLINQVAVHKFWWEKRVEKRKVRTVQVDNDGLAPEYKIEKKREDRVLFDGPKTKLVDPFDFIIDPKATDPQDANYVGDRCYLTYDQLKNFERQGFLKNVDKLKGLKARATLFTPQMDYFKWSRSPIERYGYNSERDEVEAGQPLRIEVVELWGKFDLFGTGDYVESVITIANADTVLRAMPNPYDHQFRPYATARAARNGHDFWGTGPFDNAVRLNQHLDRYHSIFLRAAEVAACPMVFVGEDSEMPDSLYKVRPFSVFRGTGDVKMTTVPSGVLSAAPMVLGSLTKQIEETVGSYKIQMGQNDVSGTATEATLSLQEGNRRMRGLIRCYADMLDQSLKIINWMNLQFLTDRVAFRVLGKRAQEIGDDYLELGPDSFLEDVDFEFVGVESLSTYGMRATGLQQILATAGPIIVQNPDRIDQVGIIHELMEALLGADEADRFVRVPTDRTSRMSQPEENLRLEQAIPIHASPDDPHQKHIQDMLPLIADMAKPGNKYSLQSKKCLMDHFMEHAQLLERQQEDAMVQQQQAQQRQSMLAPQAGGDTGPGGGQSPVAGGFSAAMNQNGTPAAPGPPNGSVFGTTGRQNSRLSSSQDTLD